MTELFDKLYARFLNGKTDLKTFKELKRSLNQLSDAELSEKMKNHWENDEFPSMEVSRKQKIHRQLHKQIIPQKNFILGYRIAVAVAAVIICSVVGWNLTLLQKQQDLAAPFLAEVPAGDKVQLTLPDRSSVKLNSESTLSYAYVNGKRITQLNGEAYFQVSKDKKHPFVVQVGDLNIEVLGTSFNVYSYDENDYVETSLLEGSIRLYDSKTPNKSFILKPSQKAIYSKSDGNIRFRNTDNVKELAWIQERLVFESEKLSTVIHKIERWYGVKIHLLCPEIANDRISGSFKDEQLPYVMEALKFQYKFDYEITGNQVIISKSKNIKNK